MAKLTQQQFSDKTFELTERFNHYIFDHPDILDKIPDGSMLVLLDVDDPDFNHANMELAHSTAARTGNPLVYVRMHKQVRIIEQVEWEPEILSSSLAS